MTQFIWILIADVIAILLDRLILKRIAGEALGVPYYIYIGFVTLIFYILFV